MHLEVCDLTESIEFLNTILDNIPSAVFVVDSEVLVRAVNDSFQALFEKPEERALGQLCGNSLGCEFAFREGKDCGCTSQCGGCELRAALLRALSAKAPSFRTILHRSFHIGGQLVEKHFQYTVRPIRYEDQPMALIIIDDVTELERRRLRLEELNQIKTRFLGIAAHDLRNPIHVIKIYMDLFQSGELGELPEAQQNAVTRISRSIDVMLRLINDLLDLSAIESGKLELELATVRLADYLAEFHHAASLLAAAKKIELRLELEPDLSWVRLDPNRIDQVLYNLLTNALKFSDAGTCVTLGARWNGPEAVEIWVADQGPGIAAAELAHIFKEYGKASARATAGEKSTGLGLAIAKRLVEAHGGRIHVASRPGQGSTFTVALPIQGQEDAPPSPAEVI